VGISDYAQDALGDVVFVDLPEVGRTVTAGESIAEIESTKSVAEVYAPIDGVIAAVNEMLIDAPETINQDPYGDGWFVLITPAEGAEPAETMDAAGYAEYTE
jgi:glycine cleavage system H protein